MIALLAVLAPALAFSVPGPAPACSLAQPNQCYATNELVVSRGFEPALRRFIGPGRASWFEPNGDMADQVLMTLYGPGFEPVHLDDGLIQFGACMAHICPERGAVFVTPQGQIRLVTMLFHNCHAKACSGDERYTLAVFLRENSPALLAHAREWAAGELGEGATRMPMLTGPEDMVGETLVYVATE